MLSAWFLLYMSIVGTVIDSALLATILTLISIIVAVLYSDSSVGVSKSYRIGLIAALGAAVLVGLYQYAVISNLAAVVETLGILLPGFSAFAVSWYFCTRNQQSTGSIQ